MMQTELDERTQIIMNGLVDFFKAWVEASPLKTAEIQKSPATFLYASGVHYAPCNGILNSSFHYRPTVQEIEDSQIFFKTKALPFVWWTSDKKLENHGFQYGSEMSGISIELKTQKNQIPPPKGIIIKPLKKQEELKRAAEILAVAFNLTSIITEEFYQVFLHLKEDQIMYGAFEEDKMVSVVHLSLGKETAGFWNFGTLPEYEKRGIGTSLVYQCILEAKKAGHQHLMAILMPKGKAWHLCQKIGFKAICPLPFYIYGSNPDDLEK